MNKAIKYRIYPTPEQAEFFAKKVINAYFIILSDIRYSLLLKITDACR